MANTTYNFTKAVALTDYMPAFRQNQKEQLWDYGKVTGMKKTSRATEQVFSYAGLPAPSRTGQLEPIFYADMSELGATTFTVSKRTLATMFSHELLKDSIHIRDILKEAGSAAGESMAYSKALIIASTFNRAFNSSYTLYDDVELCGTHTMKSGDSFVNELTAASITPDNIWLAVNHFETSLLSQSGLYLKDSPKYLMAHPSKKKEVIVALQSQLESGTADNDKNILKDYNIIPVFNRFLSTSTN